MNKMELFAQIETAPFEKGFRASGEGALDRRHQKIVEAVPAESNVLEIGPGDGKLGVYFISKYQPYYMIDISKKRLFSFYEHIGNEMKTPCYVFEEPWEWEILECNIAQTVIAAEVIEHVDDYKWMINEMIRLSRGKVILTTPVGQSFFSPDHKHFFSEEDFEFIERPYTIEQIATKESDYETGQRCFFIIIDAI